MKGQSIVVYDKIIIGAGLYGLYAAEFCGKRGQKTLVLEYDDAPFKRATYINQARVHNGYHYPRSYSTAAKSAGYFSRFNKDYGFCISNKFDKIYATSREFSWSDAQQFQKFCRAAEIRCEALNPNQYFKEDFCDGAFLTEEYAFDAHILRNYFLDKFKELPSVEIRYKARIEHIENNGKDYVFTLDDNTQYKSEFVLNATYASINQLLKQLNFETFRIKYELCEIIICQVNEKLKDIGLTVMDGPFFSIMPFGKTKFHSLTSVTFTPHIVSKDKFPIFECQSRSNGFCSPQQLGNCNDCPVKPDSAWPYMNSLARKYLREEYEFTYIDSLFSMKPILLASEIDDSRPTLIRTYTTNPTFVSVLSGKINTVYDLEDVLTNGTQ